MEASTETIATTDTSSEAAATETTTEATTVNTEGEAQSATSYLNGKYTSVSELEKGYTELQSTFSKKTQEYNENLGKFAETQAPDEYILNEGYERNDRIDALMEFGKENGMSNDYLNNIIDLDRQSVMAQVAREKEALGKDADARIQNVVDWGRANLGEEAIGTLNAMITTAQGVEMFEAISKMNSGTAPVQVAQPKTVADSDTLKQMRYAQDEFGSRKMSSNPQYRAKVEAMEAEFVANGGKL